jgi:ABC-type oligopeptide transport system ATPase subunit
VTFGYEPSRPVLHDICLTIPAGRTIALVGPTGSGKTTILSLLTRMYDCQDGQIRLDGVDIRRATFASLRRQMGVVLQTNYLFSGSILDNIRYARPDAEDGEVFAAAGALGVHELFLGQPAGYQTEVGERGAAVSLGLRQLAGWPAGFFAGRSYQFGRYSHGGDGATSVETACPKPHDGHRGPSALDGHACRPDRGHRARPDHRDRHQRGAARAPRRLRTAVSAVFGGGRMSMECGAQKNLGHFASSSPHGY